MKKILLIALLLCSAQTFAQQGSFYLGGMVGYGSNTHKDYSGTSVSKTVTNMWTFAPEFGTFLKDDIQLGLALGLGGETVKVDSGKVSSLNEFNPTVYCRKFVAITDNFKVFAGLYLNYLSSKNTYYNDITGNDVTKTAGFGARLGIGIAYAFTPRITAVGQYGLCGFSSTTTKDTDGNKTDQDSGFDFGVNTVGGSTYRQANGSGSVFNVGIYYTIFEK